MQVPTVHLNGTGADGLLRQLTEASDALRLAMAKLSDASPHGRDYYPQGPGVISAALAEHRERYRKLAEVYDELQELGRAVADGGHQRS